MAKYRVDKTNFTSGEVAPPLLGRGDLSAYENGASRLRNVHVRPTGCVVRRPGLRYLDTVTSSGRFVPFEFNTEQVYLLVFLNEELLIYKKGVYQATIPTPWTLSHLAQLNWTQSADTLLCVHPDVPPKRISRTSDTEWWIADWSFETSDNGRIHIPHRKFADSDVKLTRSSSGSSVILTATDHVFHPDHRNYRFRYQDVEVIIDAVGILGSSQVNGWYDKARVTVVEDITSTDITTRDWTEQAFSTLRGWPTSVTFHQDRLAIGGSRSLPNTLWMSKSSDLFNFDQGEGLDDESIEFSILSDQVNAIRAVFSGRHLQIFTSGAEWMVTGSPLTPTNIQLNRQTRIGSPVDRIVSPRDIDGATVFVPRNDNQIREFLFADVEQAYQASDLALLSEHIVNKPLEMDYDQNARLLHIVMSDGTLATLTVYRSEQVAAWTVQETDGQFKSVAVVGNDVFVLVERMGDYFLEVFDTSLNVDCGLDGFVENPTGTWGGLNHLNGRSVTVLADGSVQPKAVVIDGQIDLETPAMSVQAGLSYGHVVEPLPPSLSAGSNGAQGRKLRPVAITFRLDETYALRLDLGRGPFDVPFRKLGTDKLSAKPAPFTGDKTIRAIGWQQDGTRSAWRIEQDIPLPFNLLSVTTEVSVNG